MSPKAASFLHVEGASETVAVEVNRRPNLSSNLASKSICPHLSGINRKGPWTVATTMFRS
jgi:hypothetical protein